MSALAYFLERAGIATTGISLVRENSASMRPPRALWVSFPLGRPLGVPHDPAFQHRVIAAALALLDAPAGPVLADYAEDAPTGSGGAPFCSIPLQVTATDSIAALRAERALLMPWFELARRTRGRTSVGLSKLDEGARWELFRRALGKPPVTTAEVRALTLVLEDLKAEYSEAASAMPGEIAEPGAVMRWLYRDTKLGTLVRMLRDAYAQHPEPRARAIARAIAPRGAFDEEIES